MDNAKTTTLLQSVECIHPPRPNNPKYVRFSTSMSGHYFLSYWWTSRKCHNVEGSNTKIWICPFYLDSHKLCMDFFQTHVPSLRPTVGANQFNAFFIVIPTLKFKKHNYLGGGKNTKERNEFLHIITVCLLGYLIKIYNYKSNIFNKCCAGIVWGFITFFCNLFSKDQH